VLTLPIICSLIFFALELIKINITQSALNVICAEASFLTISHSYANGSELIEKIDTVIEKYRPSFIGYAVIRYHFETYDSLIEMCRTPPYGGTDIHWPNYENDSAAQNHSSPTYGSNTKYFLPSGGNVHWHFAYDNCWAYVLNISSGKCFVLTVSCSYQFSSQFVKRLFSGGSNAMQCKSSCLYGNVGSVSDFTKADVYLLWARGAGIVN
jgi:hypothetical protein